MKTKIFYPLTDDICFKYIFGRNDILKDFLNSFFEYIGEKKKVKKVEITTQKEMIGSRRKNKVFYGDILAYLDTDETADILNNDTGIILFGNPEDLKTRSIVETLFMVANDNELDLKYYNPSTYEDNGIDEFADIVGALSAFLPSNDDGEKLLRTPDVYFVKDGEIVGNFYGSIDEFNDEELTDEQKEELYDHYNQLAKLVK